MRAYAFLFEQRAQPAGSLELGLRDLLAPQIRFLVRDELECELVAVLAQEPPGEEFVDAVERKGVRSDEPGHVRLQSRG